MSAQNKAQITAKLNNLEMWEMATIETENGKVIVQKLQYGFEAWAVGDNLPAREVGVQCMTVIAAFEHQANVLVKFAPVVETVEEIAPDTNLEIAFRQTYQNLVVLAETPEIGERWHNALIKAMREIETNRSIRLFDDILAFVSGQSNKSRFVTKYGCHETCDCKANISYHSAMYAILAAYVRLGTDKSEVLCDFCGEATDATGIIHRTCEDAATFDGSEFEAQENEEWLYELAAA